MTSRGDIRKRTTATFGRLDQEADSLDAVINGVLKATGDVPVAGEAAEHGLLPGLDNLEALKGIRPAIGRALEFIIARRRSVATASPSSS